MQLPTAIGLSFPVIAIAQTTIRPPALFFDTLSLFVTSALQRFLRFCEALRELTRAGQLSQSEDMEEYVVTCPGRLDGRNDSRGIEKSPIRTCLRREIK